MIRPTGASESAGIVVINRPGDRSVELKIGSIVRATVLRNNGDGTLTLRIRDTESGGPVTLRASSEIPLDKGQSILLEVKSATDILNMRLLPESEGARSMRIPPQLAGLMDASRLRAEELGRLLSLLEALPAEIKEKIPRLDALLRTMNPDTLNGRILKAFVESSGVGLETRLRIAAFGHYDAMYSMRENGDLKAALLQLQRLLEKRDAASALRRAGFDIREISSLAERFTRNIEILQLTSRLNDIFCTFIPVEYLEASDGEISFRKGRSSGRRTWNCDIHLDFGDSGALHAGITMSGADFFITFRVQSEGLASALESGRDALTSRFSAAGLRLKAVNIVRTDEMETSDRPAGELSIRI